MDISSPGSSFMRRRVLRAWTEEEDELLIAHIEAHGEGNWNDIPRAAGILRTGKSCRSRWYRYLHPSINFGGFTEEEEEMIINLHGTIGNRWSVIAKCLPGRTNGDIRKHWRSQYMRRKLISRGIDPDTHGPNNNQAAAETSHAAALYNAPLMSERFRRENQANPAEETSSELNLELTIRPLNRELRT